MLNLNRKKSTVTSETPSPAVNAAITSLRSVKVTPLTSRFNRKQ